MKKNLIMLLVFSSLVLSCKKPPEEVKPETDDASLTREILNDFSYKVVFTTYSNLEYRAGLLHEAVNTLTSATTDPNLNNARQAWREARQAWEQSEGFLFGPVATEDLDPGIDSWPVNQADFDALLASATVLDISFINGAQNTLRGFHPLEYILFGADGNKTASQLTLREKEYMSSLVEYLKNQTVIIRKSWDPGIPDNYLDTFITAGPGNFYYSTRKSAYLEMVNAIIGICDEVANEKIEVPLLAQDPTLEESQFSHNSVKDFTDNMKSVKNVYLGKYFEDGHGLDELVAAHSKSLDQKINSQVNAAISALDNITLPFGQAIVSQQTQVHAAQDAINTLRSTLEDELLPLITQYVKD